MGHSLFEPVKFTVDQTTVIAGETRRQGGVSPSPFHSLNLGLNTLDSESNVKSNQARLLNHLGWSTEQIALSEQVHHDQILHVKTPGQYSGYDAMITNHSGILLTITIADCCPILIYDPINEAIGAAHAGWKGTVLQIGSKTLARMEQEFGTKAQDARIYIGSCIGLEQFEVGPEVAEHFTPKQKKWYAQKEKFHVDLKQANIDQFTAHGVELQHIIRSPHSTAADLKRFFSYRAENGQTGRMMAFIGLLPKKQEKS